MVRMRNDGLSTGTMILLAVALAITLILSNLVTYNLSKRKTIDLLDEIKDNLDGELLKINENLAKNISYIDEKVVDIKLNLDNKIIEQAAYDTQERKALEDHMLLNFQILEDVINAQTSQLKLDLDSQLTNVNTRIEETNLNIDTKISKIKVKSSDFSDIVEEVIRSVVSIKTEDKQGSGVLIDRRGYIITNKHVIENSTSLVAIDHLSRRFDAKVIKVSNEYDLALIKIDSAIAFDYLQFEDTYKVGTRVIAIGNPKGLSFSVTEGIISAIGRKIDSTGIGYIQIDVPINKGNSGGPLISSNKRIVGINTFKLGESEGIGFAIPSDVIKKFAES